MYKTIYLDHDKYGCDIQEGNVKHLENFLNEWYENGWELVNITCAPLMYSDDYCGYVVVLKK